MESSVKHILEQQGLSQAEVEYVINQGGSLRAQLWLEAPRNATDQEYLAFFLNSAADGMFVDAKPDLINVNTCSTEGDSMLHTACIWGDLRAVQLLIKAGAQVNSLGDMNTTPLHFAVSYRFTDVIACLLENGADKNIKDDFGYTPLEWATQMQYEDVLSTLAAG